MSWLLQGEHGGTRLASLDRYGPSSMGEQVRGVRPKTPLKGCRDAVDVSGASVHHFDGFTMNSLWSILLSVESISRRIVSASLA